MYICIMKWVTTVDIVNIYHLTELNIVFPWDENSLRSTVLATLKYTVHSTIFLTIATHCIYYILRTYFITQSLYLLTTFISFTHLPPLAISRHCKILNKILSPIVIKKKIILNNKTMPLIW